MLKEIVMILYVCTPAAQGAEADGPVCRPEALTAVMPANPQQFPAVCNALGAAAAAKWGPGGTEAPDHGKPIACFGVDHSKE